MPLIRFKVHDRKSAAAKTAVAAACATALLKFYIQAFLLNPLQVSN